MTTVFPAATVLENVMRGAFARTPVSLFGSVLNTPSARAVLGASQDKCDRLLDRLGLTPAQAAAVIFRAAEGTTKEQVATKTYRKRLQQLVDVLLNGLAR